MGPRRRRNSHPSPPPTRRGDKPSRPHHSRRYEDRSPSPAPRSSKKRDARDRDTRSHHSGGSNSGHGGSDSANNNKKPHRPSLSRSQTAPYEKDPKKARGSSSRSFSFLSDPRFMTAAEAALAAGATAAFAPGGGKWDGDMGAKVLRAGLGAAAISALKNSATSGPAPEPAAAAPAPEPAPAPAAPAATAVPVETPGASAGRYVGRHMGRRGTERRRHH